MAIFNYGTPISWLINPIGNVINKLFPDSSTKEGESILPGIVDRVSNFRSRVANRVQELWDDYTGKSQIEMQNEYNREMAEEEYQRNLQSIGDTAAAYEAAGFNRNLMYSSSPASYQAPQLQAYSGSSKLDTIMSRVGKVLNFIPAMYQATAALESIDQARERTKQAEIKTMSDGISMLRNSYELGKSNYSLPFVPVLKRPGRDWMDQTDFIKFGTNDLTRRYADAALRNTFDTLDAIGISNSLRNTRNSYLGYQYDLDRRFGAWGRAVGIASQGLGAVGKLILPKPRLH